MSRPIFSKEFKAQAVKKALGRGTGVKLAEIALTLGIGESTLSKWLGQARSQDLVKMEGAKRPQDWSRSERLEMIIRCSSLSESETSQICRESGIYPHHLVSWKRELVAPEKSRSEERAEKKALLDENKALKRELKRKEKALIEASALLMLQKKAQEIWGKDEDD